MHYINININIYIYIYIYIYITLHYITLHHITSHYITLHDITMAAERLAFHDVCKTLERSEPERSFFLLTSRNCQHLNFHQYQVFSDIMRKQFSRLYLTILGALHVNQAMWCDVLWCNAMQCNAMQCNAMQCNAM